MRTGAAFLSLIVLIMFHRAEAQKGFSIQSLDDKKKIEVRFNGILVTAYCYFDSTEKPVLFPLRTLSGNTVTRGYPVAPRPGERTDHPHHLGLWLNYERVNGLDFWNNSTAISPEKKPGYGSIRHQKIVSASGKNDRASIETVSHWVDNTGKTLLEEKTKYLFTTRNNDLVIDRTTVLKAVVPEVVFADTKDGLIGIRVARELEMPSKENSKYVDASGNITTVSQTPEGAVTGMYVSDNGLSGDAVWGTRAPWTALNGVKDGENISIVIIDHPSNPGYPTYWHARGYGLFAANPLGQKIFSKGTEELNLTLRKGESTTFRFRVIVHGGASALAPEAIDNLASEFAKTK
ncbi:MAG TPA: PmoA family protein [Chryseosolibacter sp.]|nr:PmoA family protein [Chryseosolibacter sp.]